MLRNSTFVYYGIIVILALALSSTLGFGKL